MTTVNLVISRTKRGSRASGGGMGVLTFRAKALDSAISGANRLLLKALKTLEPTEGIFHHHSERTSRRSMATQPSVRGQSHRKVWGSPRSPWQLQGEDVRDETLLPRTYPSPHPTPRDSRGWMGSALAEGEKGKQDWFLEYLMGNQELQRDLEGQEGSSWAFTFLEALWRWGERIGTEGWCGAVR